MNGLVSLLNCTKLLVIILLTASSSVALAQTNTTPLEATDEDSTKESDGGKPAAVDVVSVEPQTAAGSTRIEQVDSRVSNGATNENSASETDDAAKNALSKTENANTQKDENERLRLQIEVIPGSAEYASVPAQKIDGKGIPLGLTTSYELTSRGTIIDNLDFRKLVAPDAPFIDIQNSDDRTIFATTRIAAGLKYKPIEQIETAVSVSHTGLWGNHNISSKKVLGGLLSVERLFVQWNIWQNEKFSISTTVGRQSLSLGSFVDAGGVLRGNKSRNYILSGTIDGVTLDAKFGKYGALKLMPLDLYAVGGRPAAIATATSTKGKQKSHSMRFNGENNTFRVGGIYENTTALDGLAARAFFFYADIGTGGTGADRSYDGATGNVPDNDYNWMTGVRLNYTLPVNDVFALGFGAEYARSGGIDRKATQAGYYDVDTIGNAYGASVIAAISLPQVKLVMPVQFFMADGGRYTAKEGLPYSHGFTSFKGQGVGGLLMNNGLGWKPSAYIADGVGHRPYDKYRASGSMVLSAGLETSFFHDKLAVDLNAWYVADTSSSAFDQKNIDKAASQPAFGYTRADLEAQNRLGLPLATEIDLEISYLPFDILTVYCVGGILLPGEGFKVEIDRMVGSAIGSTEPVMGWGASLGMTLSL